MLNDYFNNFIFNPMKGFISEQAIRLELLFMNSFGWNGKSFENVYIPKENGETTELDVVYVTSRGIFVIESKNYSGWIFGDEKSYKWTVMLPTRQKFQFYNPVIQNRNHIKHLSEYLGNEYPVYSFVVFSDRAVLKKVTVASKDVIVTTNEDFLYELKKFSKDLPVSLSDKQLNDIHEKLKVASNVDSDVKKEHRRKIKEKTGDGICVTGKEFGLKCIRLLGPCSEFLFKGELIYKSVNEYLNKEKKIFLPELKIGYRHCRDRSIFGANDELILVNESNQNDAEIVRSIAKAGMWNIEQSEIIYGKYYMKDYPEYIKINISGKIIALRIIMPETMCRENICLPIDDYSTVVMLFPSLYNADKKDKIIDDFVSRKDRYFWISNMKIDECYDELLKKMRCMG